MRKYSIITTMLFPLLLIVSMVVISGIQTQNSTPAQSDNVNTLITTSAAPTGLWDRTWGTWGMEYARAVAVDTSGNIFCAGTTYVLGAGGTDFALVKYLPTGIKAWNTTWGGHLSDECFDVAVDKSGNIYCSGITITFGVETNDFALVKFFPNGTKAWNVTWGSSGDEACYGLRLDATGHIYCIGYTDTFGAGNNDLALVKFFPNGTKDWNVTWGGSDYDTGQDLAIASNGNVYCLAGTESFGAGDSDFALVKFYPNGTKAWNTTWGAHANENARKIAINSNDAIYCFGDSASFADPSKDLVLVKFFPNGTLDWNITWGTPNTENAQGLAINPCDEIYLTYDIEGSSMPLIVEKFDANGIKEWNTSWDGSGDEFGIDIAVDSNGNIYCLADYFTDQYDFLVVKFSDPLDCLPPSGIPGFEAIAVLLSLFFLIHIYTVRKHRRLPKII